MSDEVKREVDKVRILRNKPDEHIKAFEQLCYDHGINHGDINYYHLDECGFKWGDVDEVDVFDNSENAHEEDGSEFSVEFKYDIRVYGFDPDKATIVGK